MNFRIKTINLIFSLFLITLIFSCENKNRNNERDVRKNQIISKQIIWKHGIAFLGNNALYINPDKMEEESIIISEKSINQTQGNLIIGSTLIFVEGNKLYVYNSKKDDPYFRLTRTKRIFRYKFENNELLISQNGINWDKLIVKLIKEFDPFRKSEQGEPIYMIIKLKCKWFENYYEIIGTPG